jgi:hypothetical protein
LIEQGRLTSVSNLKKNLGVSQDKVENYASSRKQSNKPSPPQAAGMVYLSMEGFLVNQRGIGSTLALSLVI